MKKINYYTSNEIIDRATENMVVLESQKDFTKQMATIISMHLAKVKAMVEHNYAFNQLPNNSCFVISPTGTGKTYILKALSKAAEINVSFIDSTQLTQAGYKGLNLTEAIAKIVDDNLHFFKTANMLVFDEFDKTFFSSENAYYNASNVQRDLLKLFEGSEYSIRIPGSLSDERKTVNLDKTLIVLAGACSEIGHILENRYTPKNKLGFSFNENIEKPTEELIKLADINDLVEYGMLRELAGRVNSVFSIGSLSKDDYKTIITSNSKVSSIAQYRNLFKMCGCKINLSGTAVNKIADIAVKRNMGARTVNAVLNEQINCAYSFLESHTEYNKAILQTDDNGEFFIKYKKGERKLIEPLTKENTSLSYNLKTELMSGNAIDEFCDCVCSLIKLNNPQKETFLYSFLQTACRYLSVAIRPHERTVENILKFALSTKRPCENGSSAFEIICSDYLKTTNKTLSAPWINSEFTEEFEVFFEIYKESYLANADKILNEILSDLLEQYVENKRQTKQLNTSA